MNGARYADKLFTSTSTRKVAGKLPNSHNLVQEFAAFDSSIQPLKLMSRKIVQKEKLCMSQMKTDINSLLILLFTILSKNSTAYLAAANVGKQKKGLAQLLKLTP